MRNLFKLLIPISIIAMSGCVVAPYGYYRGGYYHDGYYHDGYYRGYYQRGYYYGPGVAVVAPAPVVVVRP
jgi:hypothetical protein